MSISDKKNYERKIFKDLRDKSSSPDKKKVEINVKIYIESVFTKAMKKKHIGIYWPLKNEVDLKSLNDNYSLDLPRCDKNKELLFCKWIDKKLTKDSQGILSPNSSLKLSYEDISMFFIPCLAVDKSLIRLGYGGGFFDRLRSNENWRSIPCIGVLTSNCVSHDLLTRADWDIPLSGYITEKEILV